MTIDGTSPDFGRPDGQAEPDLLGQPDLLAEPAAAGALGHDWGDLLPPAGEIPRKPGLPHGAALALDGAGVSTNQGRRAPSMDRVSIDGRGGISLNAMRSAGEQLRIDRSGGRGLFR